MYVIGLYVMELLLLLHLRNGSNDPNYSYTPCPEILFLLLLGFSIAHVNVLPQGS